MAQQELQGKAAQDQCGVTEARSVTAFLMAGTCAFCSRDVEYPRSCRAENATLI
jgi:hypothetical protein